MLKISYADCLGLYPVIFGAVHSRNVCGSLKIANKIH